MAVVPMQLGLVSQGDGFARWQHILSSIYLAAVCVQLSGSSRRIIRSFGQTNTPQSSRERQ
jgi:hypothetical protein